MKLVGRMRNNFLVDSCQLIVDSLIPSPSDSAKSEQKLVRVRLLLLIVGIGIFSSCDKKQTSEKTGIETKSIITAPLFNPDSAYKYVGAQVAFGYRIPNTPAHRKCGDYIIQSLEKYGCKVTVQEFSIKTHDNQ